MSVPKIEDLRAILPAPGGNYELLTGDQTVYDIVREVMTQHKMNQPDADKIARFFWAGNDIETANRIFDFCKKYLPYDFEPAKTQTVKTLGQILNDAGTAPQDCKHYALFCGSILHSLQRQGYPVNVVYRFASDVKNHHYPKHVFVVLKTASGEYWVDPVLKSINQDYKYYYTLDKKPKTMALYRVSGLSDREQIHAGNAFVSGFDGAYVGKHGRGREKLKKFGKKLSKIQPGRVLLKVGGAVPRNSFLLILKMNTFDLAKHLFEGGQNPTNKEKIKRKWESLGGKWGALAKAINDGYHHYLFRHKQKMNPAYHNINGVMEQEITGLDGQYVGVALSAAIASATPIILAFKGLLASLGINTKVPDLKNIQKATMDATIEAHNLEAANQSDPTQPIEHSDGTVTHATMTPGGAQQLEVIKTGRKNHENDYAPDLMPPPAGPDMPPIGPTGLMTRPGDEIPNAQTGAEKAVNVATDWGRGAKNFIQNNRGTVITIASITGAVLLGRAIFSPHKRR